MLSETRRGAPQRAGSRGEALRGAWLPHGATHRMVALVDDSAGDDLRMFEEGFAIEHGCAGDVLGFEALQPLGAGTGQQDLLQQGQPLTGVGYPAPGGREPLVLQPVFAFYGAT